jgi:uroporphyrinogen-III decarboxylase
VGLSFLVALNGMDRALLGLLDEPRLAHAALDRGDAVAIARGSYWLERGWRVLRINDSAGNLSVISPATWREFVAPHLATVVAELHRRCPDALLYCHVCGNTLPVIGDLAATGLDAIAPLDPLGGFTVADARRALEEWMAERAGEGARERTAGPLGAMAPVPSRRPALMGGINTLSFVDGTPASVAAEAAACIAGARGPGDDDRAVPAAFVLGSGCVVPRGARAACLRAARDAARATGGTA